MPLNPFMRLGNRMAVSSVRRTGKFMGMSLIALDTVGAKSGERRTAPVASFPVPDGGWIVVASAGGGPRNPGWFYNLLAHPDQVVVEAAGRRTPVTPVQLAGEERERAIGDLLARAPRFSGYFDKAKREIPIVRLEPRD
jgi:deazaflavin-dependent oxidoreductase (nitroreductase family)